MSYIGGWARASVHWFVAHDTDGWCQAPHKWPQTDFFRWVPPAIGRTFVANSGIIFEFLVEILFGRAGKPTAGACSHGSDIKLHMAVMLRQMAVGRSCTPAVHITELVFLRMFTQPFSCCWVTQNQMSLTSIWSPSRVPATCDLDH